MRSRVVCVLVVTAGSHAGRSDRRSRSAPLMCTVNNTGLRLSPCGVTIAIANEWQSLVNRRGSSDVAASSKLIGQPHIWQVWPECHRPRLLGRRSACLCLTSSVVIASGCRVDFLMKAGSVFMAESLNWRLKLSMSRTLKSKKTSGSLKVPYVRFTTKSRQQYATLFLIRL